MSAGTDGAQPLIDRRSFLRRTIAAFAVGAAGTTTALVATRPAAAMVQEDPAIVALGERIEPLLVAHRNAAERLEARARAEVVCPAVPEELVCTSSFWVGLTDDECDIEGKEIRVLFVDGKDGKKHAILPRQNTEFREN